MSKKLTLRRKLFLARKAAMAVDKKGEADWGKFARHEDVLAEASKQLEKRGILIVPSMAEEELHFGKSGTIAKAVLSYEVLDTESDESIGPLRWAGTGHDEPGDKALYKATTGAGKYFLANLLAIPFGSDPEETDASKPTAVSSRPDAGDGPGLLVLRDLASNLKAIGAPADMEDVERLLADCDIKVEPGDVIAGLVPITREQGESVYFEVERIKQDRAAEEPDRVPRRERPLPETDLPEPDYTGLLNQAEEVAVDA